MQFFLSCKYTGFFNISSRSILFKAFLILFLCLPVIWPVMVGLVLKFLGTGKGRIPRGNEIHVILSPYRTCNEILTCSSYRPCMFLFFDHRGAMKAKRNKKLNILIRSLFNESNETKNYPTDYYYYYFTRVFVIVQK